MGLDVYLYQFKDVDTEVILELSRLSEEPYSQKEREVEGEVPVRRRNISFRRKQNRGIPETRSQSSGIELSESQIRTTWSRGGKDFFSVKTAS